MKKVSRNSVDISDCRVSGLFEIVLCCLLKRRQPSDLRFDNLGKFVHEKQKAHVIAQDDRLTAGAWAACGHRVLEGNICETNVTSQALIHVLRV